MNHKQKTTRMLEVEKKIGKPVEDAMNEIYQRTLSTRKTAKELGIGYVTARRWFEKLEVPMRRLIFPTDGSYKTPRYYH